MDLNIKSSILSFQNELNAREEIFKNSKVVNNLDSNNITSINNIISKYTKIPPKDINYEVITSINNNDLEKLLLLVGLNDTEVKHYLKDFNANLYLYNNLSDIKELSKIKKYFESISALITNYINDYEEIRLSQKKMREDKIKLYDKYLDLTKKDHLDIVFNDFDELSDLLSKLSIPISDRINIINYFNNMNLNIKPYGIESININNKINKLSKIYLTDNKVNKIIKEYLKDNDIDIDLIPSISRKISDKYNIDYNKVINILSLYIIINLYNLYNKYVLDDSIDLEDNVLEMIKQVFSYIDDDSMRIINKAKDILVSDQELYNDELNKGNDIMKYVDIPLSDLENNGISKSNAIKLKELPLTKTISDTLDKIDMLDRHSDDYNKSCKLLNSLIGAYNEMEKSN